MNLTIPTVGSQPGPQYASDINSALTLIDQHDHSEGRGVPITPAGMNIDENLSLESNSLIDATSLVFVASSSGVTTPMALSVAPGGESPAQQDLWFTPDTGIPIQITKNGAVNATVSSIDGETYAAGTFFWTQSQDMLPTTPANFDIGSIILRPNTAATAFGVQLVPPSAISSQYSINLPLLPASQKIMTLDASGNMTAPYVVDNSTIVIATNTIKVPDGGITNTQIADATITGSKLVDETIGFDQLAPGFNGEWNVESHVIAAPAFAVRVATTVNGTLATAFDNGSVVDGVTLVTNDIILVKNQSASTEDGVYIVQASGAPVRHGSYDTAAELTYASVSVTAGTTNTGTYWWQNNALTTLSDAQSWSNDATIAGEVPADVNLLALTLVGGGGGGGGGRGVTASTGPGGAGGGGGEIRKVFIPVSGGDTYIVQVGAGGLAGAAGASPGNGGSGGTGGTTSLTINGMVLQALGGVGGTGGGVAGSNTGGTGGNSGDLIGVGVGGAPGTPASAGTYAGNSGAGGGGGSVAVGDAAGGAGAKSFYINSTSTGGAEGTNSAGGGGGGGAALAVGGDGGIGGNSPGAGIAGATSSGAGGGGGGGKNGTGVGGAGGAGGSGLVAIYWLGSPS